jgi:hypothetical protein
LLPLSSWPARWRCTRSGDPAGADSALRTVTREQARGGKAAASCRTPKPGLSPASGSYASWPSYHTDSKGECQGFPHFPGSGKSCRGIHRLTDQTVRRSPEPATDGLTDRAVGRLRDRTIRHLTDTSALVPPRLYLPANVAMCGTRPAGWGGHSPCHGRNTRLTRPTNAQRGPAHLGGWAVFRSSGLLPACP